MYTYFAYGLGIHSELPLPELVAGDFGCDVTIRVDDNGSQPAADFTGPASFRISAHQAVLAVRKVGVFTVAGTTEIRVAPEPGVGLSDELLRMFLINQVMGILMFQRRHLVLHASCIGIDGTAVAFLGQQGWGKSTVAAACCRRGHTVVADDVTAVSVDSGFPTVQSGPLRLKLGPDTATALGFSTDALRPLYPNSAKVSWSAPHNTRTEPMPLRRVFVLDEGADPGIAALRPQEAAIELVRHSYLVNLPPFAAREQFLRCTKLANQVTIQRLNRGPALSMLPSLIDLIETELARD